MISLNLENMSAKVRFVRIVCLLVAQIRVFGMHEQNSVCKDLILAIRTKPTSLPALCKGAHRAETLIFIARRKCSQTRLHPCTPQSRKCRLTSQQKLKVVPIVHVVMDIILHPFVLQYHRQNTVILFVSKLPQYESWESCSGCIFKIIITVLAGQANFHEAG